jgi:hypothetical protein
MDFGLVVLHAIRCHYIQFNETHNKQLELEELVVFGVNICFIGRGMG